MPDELIHLLQATLGDSYTLERELGGGGMGRVFVAEETTLERKVVVKVLPPELGRSLSAERFRREIQLAAKLQHPHIVPLLTAGATPDGMLYYTMPYIEGDSLRRRLTRAGELPIPEALRILRQVVDALAYAHARGVVHRDIKPDNVLLSGNHALVTDFGVSKALSTATGPTSLTSLGVALGTPSYMAPEQAAADPNTDHRADIYAIGILGYELLTGHPPFQGSSPQQVLAAHAAVPPPKITPIRPTVPQVLEDLIMSCLEKRAADRPQTAEEVLHALEALATPTHGMTPAPMQPVAAPSGRAITLRRAVALGAAAGVLALAGLGALWLNRGGEPAKLSDARVLFAPFENRTSDSSLDAIGNMAGEWVARAVVERAGIEVAGGDAAAANASEAELLRSARAQGARTAVRGGYYRVGDTLQFQLRVFDVAEARVLRTIGPFPVELRDPNRGIEAMGERVTGALAVLTRATLGRDIATTLPRFDAYREYLQGDELYDTERAKALQHFFRAYEIDTAYTWPLVRAAYIGANSDRCELTDSIGRVLAPARRRMGVPEEAYLDRVLAWCRGDWAGAYAAALRMRRAAPRSDEMLYIAAAAALYVNRPREAIATIEEIRAPVRAIPFYAQYAAALHIVAAYDEELQLGRDCNRAFPEAAHCPSIEARALIARGRLTDAYGTIGRVEALARGTEFGSLLLAGATEMAVHGHSAASRAMYARAAEWFDALPASQRQLRQRVGHVRALSFAGRGNEAVARARELVREAPDSIDVRTAFGVAAAIAGLRAAADSADAWLERLELPYLLGENTMDRARIAAAAGNASRAIALMRQAFREGFRRDASLLHSFPEFAALRSNAQFAQLIAPQG